ncbi:hypothetical protein AC1031_017504 [Aphanomyces cochlioides]|nr:hypothetical protein AC1031_017504 [Aphanomyces cochlioides]
MPPKSQPRKGIAKLPTKKELLERLLALESGAASPPNDVKKKATWTDEMIQTLLDLRLRQFAHVFDGSKSNMQLSIAWEKMTLRFNLLCEAEYSKTRFAQENEIGNLTENPIDFPTYWDTLVEYLGDKSGLGHREFGSSDRSINANSSSLSGDAVEGIPSHTSNDESHVESSKRKREAALEVQRQRKKRKVDIGAGMVQMGETLANGLIEAAKTANTSSHGDSEATKALQAVLSSLEESKSLNTAILQSISDNAAMNREILQHLQRR